MNDSALVCSPSEGAPATMGQGRVVLRGVQDILIPGDEPVCSELAAGPLQAMHDSQADGATRGGPAALCGNDGGRVLQTLFFFNTDVPQQHREYKGNKFTKRGGGSTTFY